LDEIEKHIRYLNILLQVLDEGRLTDIKGRSKHNYHHDFNGKSDYSGEI
jgi:hypothetical protein